jgi:hypothetical protein
MQSKRMKVLFGLVVFAALLLAVNTVQAAPIPYNGEHYNLNIIGVEKGKNPTAMGWVNENRHTIFVPLSSKTNIYMQQNESFGVIDADGTDGSARFQLGAGYYEVYARALGKPNNWVIITPNATYDDPYTINGTQVFDLGSIELGHTKKPTWERVTGLFLVTVTLQNTETLETRTYTNKWIFDIPELYDYWWTYDNHGQKLVQVRFYPVQEQPAP